MLYLLKLAIVHLNAFEICCCRRGIFLSRTQTVILKVCTARKIEAFLSLRVAVGIARTAKFVKRSGDSVTYRKVSVALLNVAFFDLPLLDLRLCLHVASLAVRAAIPKHESEIAPMYAAYPN